MFTIRLKDNSLVEGLSVAQIRKMASTGFISSEDMVQRIGTSTWTRAGNIPGLTFAEVDSAQERADPPNTFSSNPKVAFQGAVQGAFANVVAAHHKAVELNGELPEPWAARLFGKFLEHARIVMSATKFENIARTLTKSGHVNVVIGALVILIYSIVNAVKLNNLSLFFIALAIPVAVLVGQYVACKFINAGRSAISKTPGIFRNQAVFDVISLVYILLALAIIGVSIWGFIQLEELYVLATGFALATAIAVTSTCFLYPEVIGLKFSESGRAGEEAIGLLGGILRSFVAMSPILYGAFAVSGGALSLYSLIRLMSAGWFSPEGFYYHASLNSSIGVLALGCLIPLLSYFCFVLGILSLDVSSAVFEIARDTKESRPTKSP